MGYYIEVPRDKEKAEQLVQLYDAEIVPRPSSLSEIPNGKALICVVDNGLFEAAGFCYSEREFKDFVFDDGRPRKWLIMDLGKAKKLSGYAESW